MKSTIFALTVAFALTVGLIACSKTETPRKSAAAPAAPVQPSSAYDAVAAQGKGFTVGPMMGANPVYVLFDPQCPHCGQLWEAAVPLQSKVKFVWIPVSIIGEKSARQGAALLADSNPAEAMAVHEKSILAGNGGISAAGSVSAQLQQTIQQNTALFVSLGVDSVPYILAKNMKSGLAVSNTGAMNTAELMAFLGVAPP